MEVEVVLIKKMPHEEYLEILPALRKKGWKAQCYQPGFQAIYKEEK